MKSLPPRHVHGVLLTCRQFVNLCLRGMQNISFFTLWLWRFAATLLLELRVASLPGCPPLSFEARAIASKASRGSSAKSKSRHHKYYVVGRPMSTNNDPISLPVTSSQRKTSYLSTHAASAQRLIFLPSSTASLHFFSLYPCLPT